MRRKSTFAKNVKDPIVILRYIDTGLMYINACKSRIYVLKIGFESGGLNENDYINELTLVTTKIADELSEIIIYLKNESFQNYKGNDLNLNGANTPTNHSDYLQKIVIDKIQEIINIIGSTHLQKLPGEIKDLLTIKSI